MTLLWAMDGYLRNYTVMKQDDSRPRINPNFSKCFFNLLDSFVMHVNLFWRSLNRHGFKIHAIVKIFVI